jgi:anti-sigma regulatory factor (Ser/Thr protein kinase)
MVSSNDAGWPALTNGGGAHPQKREMDGSVEARLPRRRECAAVARRLLDKHLSARVGSAAMDDLKLVASELVGNAYLHGEGAIRLRIEWREDRVRLEVTDEGEHQAVKIREQPVLGGGGFGLPLVQELSSAWGAFEGTTHVWAEIETR